MHEVYRRVYESLGTKQVDQLLNPEVVPQPKDPAIENMEALQMVIPKAFPEQSHDAHIAAHAAFLKTRMVQINPQVYALLQGHISEHVSFKANIEVAQQISQNQEMQQFAQQNPEQYQVMFNNEVANRIAQLTNELAQAETEMDGAKQDPLVMLKQRELDLRALDMQRKAQEAAIKIQNQDSQFEEKIDVDKMKLEQQEKSDAQKLALAQQKLMQDRNRITKGK
jgi:hypothetical protein